MLDAFNEIDILFSAQMRTILGLRKNNILLPSDDHISNLETWKLNSWPNIEANYHSLYVYLDIIDAQVVSDTKTPLLAVVSTSGSFDTFLEREPENPSYVPLKKNRIKTVKVLITDIKGNNVKFNHGSVIIVLHIRNSV